MWLSFSGGNLYLQSESFSLVSLLLLLFLLLFLFLCVCGLYANCSFPVCCLDSLWHLRFDHEPVRMMTMMKERPWGFFILAN